MGFSVVMDLSGVLASRFAFRIVALYRGGRLRFDLKCSTMDNERGDLHDELNSIAEVFSSDNSTTFTKDVDFALVDSFIVPIFRQVLGRLRAPQKLPT